MIDIRQKTIIHIKSGQSKMKKGSVKKISVIVMLSSLFISNLATISANAQSSPPSERLSRWAGRLGEALKDTVRIEEVVVTGSPVKNNRNNVPMSVSVVTGA